MNEIIQIYDICQELIETTSTLGKQEILKKNEDNKLFKGVLKFLLDPMIVTGISKKKIEKSFDNVVDTDDIKLWDYDIRVLLNYLKEHNTGADNDIIYCQRFLKYYSEIDEFLKSIITKSLKLGIDKKTANKVYGKDFIPTLDVMLGTSIEKCKIPQGTWFSISQKLNGSRCFYYKGKLYTRQGKVYTGCEHIIKDLQTLEIFYQNELHSRPFMYDGELILKDDTLSDSERFQKGVGIANSDNEEKTELKLIIFDTMPIDEFENGVSQQTYRDRKALLDLYNNDIKMLNLANIEIVPMFYEGTDQNEIWKWLDYAEQNDMEGVMVNLDTCYECRRVKTLIKVKKFYTYDLPITDVVEGDGRLNGTLGALVVDYKGNKVNVGSGFSDDQRKTFWKNKNELIGRVIEVKYKEITKNKDTGLESLQFPVFCLLREIGKEVSYN